MDPVEHRDALVRKYRELRSAVVAAQEQATQAAMFHETWRPAATDAELHARMGTSFATHSFQITRWALRRELILTLMRIWDNNTTALSIKRINAALLDEELFTVIIEERVRRIGISTEYVNEMMRATLEERRQLVLPLIAKYLPNGSGHRIFKLLRELRDKRLAHHQIKEPVALVDPTNEGIEEFYQDTLEVVTHLLHLVNGVVCEISEATSMFASYARFFWASARGERTEGHPNFSPPFRDIK